jgi:ubiquinone/menaquinone biosynthesis C-methylase UbiE
MCSTGFPDDSFDVITGSYALRNAPDLGLAFREIRRILKPGGTAAFLDFSKPEDASLQALQRRLLWTWCGFWGFVLHGKRHVHGYIAESLGTYPDRTRLRKLIREWGFEQTASRMFFFGMIELIVLRNLKGLSIAAGNPRAAGNFQE